MRESAVVTSTGNRAATTPAGEPERDWRDSGLVVKVTPGRGINVVARQLSLQSIFRSSVEDTWQHHETFCKFYSLHKETAD